MSTNNRRLSHRYLERLQKAAYAQLGHPPPTCSAESLLRREAENLHALRDGGKYDIELRERLEELGLDPALRHSILENWRRGEQQLASHYDLDRILSAYSDAPTPHVHPVHHAVLKKLQSDIEELYRVFPRLSFVGELQKLNGRVTLSTLPTGQVNARTLIVPRTDEYFIVFDPVFFDFLYSFSNNFAQAINPEKAREGAKQYAVSGRETPLREVMRHGESSSVIISFFNTLRAFFGKGLPPPIEPYDENTFSLAEHLCDTAALFIAAHEYSHILLGHMQPANATEGRSRHGGPESRAWNQELEADWLACGISDAVLTAGGLPPPVRFMGVHFFFISTMIVELGLAALQTGQPQQLMGLIQKTAEQRGCTTHPVSELRVGNVNLWLQRKYSTFDRRGTEYFAALLSEVAAVLWHYVEPHIFNMRAKGIKPPALWSGFDIFEHG